MARQWLVLAILIAIFGPNHSTNARSPVACPVDRALADLIADSDLIVIGKLELPKQALLAEPQQDKSRWLEIPVAISSSIKGGSFERVTVRFYSEDAPYRLSKKAILELVDGPAMLFLTHVDEGEAFGYYFAGNMPRALEAASAPNVASARAEVARQLQISQGWRRDPSLPYYHEVRNLLVALGYARDEEQQRVFDRLEAMGPDAVPAIVSQMDDRRLLATQEIALRNLSADAFEGLRHYGPKLVVDALAAILNQITGANFGSIQSGGSDRERSAAVAGWRIYAADIPCK